MPPISTTIAKRAAERLNDHLSRIGVTSSLLERSDHLYVHINVGGQEARGLLSGLVPWSYEQLEAVAKMMKCSMGDLIDDRPNGKWPDDARVVHSADGGESIVWRCPTDFPVPQNYTGSSLRYVRAQHPVMSHECICLVVFVPAPPKQNPQMIVGRHYVLQSDSGWAVRKMTKISKDHAFFEDEHKDGTSCFLPIDPSAKSASSESVALRVFGSVVGYVVSE
jgi:hypothetical protein